MNCPYCDETVHLMSKFCPKCGLPLKEDATVMGAYASDDTGPGLWVIGGGAAAILAVTMIIGWATSQGKNKPAEQVQRQPVGNPAFNTASMNPAFGAAPSYNPAFGGGLNLGGARSANYTPSVKWAYVPPAQPVQRPLPPVEYVPTGPETPPHNLKQEAAAAPRRPAAVRVARATTPEIPAAEMSVRPMTLAPGEVMPEPTAAADPGVRERTETEQLEAEGVIAYDPVQEQYVVIPRERRRARVGGRD